MKKEESSVLTSDAKLGDFELDVVELEDVSLLPETAASSGSSSCSCSCCGSSSCSTCA